jgi:hypothetical protein
VSIPEAVGAMLVPIIAGSGKTTASAGTGQVNYWPIYGSIGNIHNNIRGTHGDGLILIGFLTIPKSKLPNENACEFNSHPSHQLITASKTHTESADIRHFCRQLFHASLATIFSSLKLGMMKPEVVLCPDGHYRLIIWKLGPYIVDYPEQVLLACIV